MESRERKDECQGGVNVPRRNLLVGAGALAAGMLLTKAGGLLSPDLAQAKAITESWPWPYVKLDPDETAELAYNEWYRLYCGGGVVSSIFSQLREKVGEPYTLFPIEAFIFLEGGVSGWGTICGSNSGANIVTNLIIGPRTAGSVDGMLMGSEIMQWYSDTDLPTYSPKNPKFSGQIPTTVSNSPLCHVSVGRWMKAADKSLGSPERRDRCARVTASVAYHTVELLNAWKDGKYQTKGTIPADFYGIQTMHNCTSCHGSDVPMPPTAKR
ncbi:MAG TPA: chain A iron centre cytochrome C protein [Desulfurivibrio alkaliphilus]|uniref:Chain A iron centre cytochrome C protein n=1 Tax=Desulfurivibrio alkaliphilus TaxID=427923 RepID=A0A7C2TLS7_9BACT|nr:chain A iron centre cytochrome C protein [Desulfurivibrio alkaliphilus]